ncbi:MAG: hypothetical protein J0M01_07555 [Dechloromonas sp.]|jgi:hypothetical protein|nr:hypothetical protein [Dechloromonas sp.]
MLDPATRELALRLLVAAVAADKKGKAGVAARLGAGCSRSLLARVLSPNDEAGMSDKLARRVIDAYHVIRACPATDGEMPISECRRIALGHAPTHNPLAMRIWKTCQTCPHKPAKGAKP